MVVGHLLISADAPDHGCPPEARVTPVPPALTEADNHSPDIVQVEAGGHGNILRQSFPQTD